MRTRKRSSVAALLILAVATPLLLTGCGLLELFGNQLETADSVGAEKIRDEERTRLDEFERAVREREEAKAEPDQVLAAGKILGVRIHYGDSGAGSCEVRLVNERNDWYDEVEWIAGDGTLGSEYGDYDDYEFGAENFNKQITNPFDNPKYQPEFVDGLYQITVSCNTGYTSSVTAVWSEMEFTPNLFSFSAG